MSQVTMIKSAAEWWGEALIDDRSPNDPRQRFSRQFAETMCEITAPQCGGFFVLGAGEALHPTLARAMDGIAPEHRRVLPPEDTLMMFMDFDAGEVTVQSGYRAPLRKLNLA